MGVETLVPLGFFASIALIFIFAFHYGHRKQQEVQETIRKAAEGGSALTPDLVRSIGAPKAPSNTDLRRGIILITIALAIIVLGWSFEGVDEDMLSFVGIAAFPGLVGVAYLGFHFLSPREDNRAG